MQHLKVDHKKLFADTNKTPQRQKFSFSSISFLVDTLIVWLSMNNWIKQSNVVSIFLTRILLNRSDYNRE